MRTWKSVLLMLAGLLVLGEHAQAKAGEGLTLRVLVINQAEVPDHVLESAHVAAIATFDPGAPASSRRP